MLSRHHRYRSARAPRRRRLNTKPAAFIGGPAAGEPLTLTRAPRFLRVTQHGPCFRVLDTYAAEPEETELIYVYQLGGRPTESPRKAALATYHFLATQPKDNQIRLTWAWRGWSIAQSSPILFQSKIQNQQS